MLLPIDDTIIAEDLTGLMQGGTVQSSLNMDVIYPRIADGADSIFSFLLVAGYLKTVRAAVETEMGTFVELALPNKEVRRVYNAEILCWLKSTELPFVGRKWRLRSNSIKYNGN